MLLCFDLIYETKPVNQFKYTVMKPNTTFYALNIVDISFQRFMIMPSFDFNHTALTP